MEGKIGTMFKGVRCPIIREGDGLAAIISQSVLSAAEAEGFELRDYGVIVVTESIVARVQGDYALVDAVAVDVKEKLGGETTGIVLPTLGYNRFAIRLKGIAKGTKKVVLMLNYPSDEVGNELISIDKLDEAGINPYSDVLSLEMYRKLFGEDRHEFIGIDYVSCYGDLTRPCGAEVEIIFANHPREILKYTKNVLTCDIHTGVRTKRVLRTNGAERVRGLDDIMMASVDRSGYDGTFGLSGSNKSTEDMVKLFPRNCRLLVQDIQKQVLQACEERVEVMVYGDGAFKDLVGRVWEPAGPCVSPAYIPGLEGAPNELKLKYLADNDFIQLKGEGLQKTIEAKIHEKEGDLVEGMAFQEIIPRRLTDLTDSLYDLTSDFGGKGTPIALIQGYFDSLTNQRVNS